VLAQGLEEQQAQVLPRSCLAAAAWRAARPEEGSTSHVSNSKVRTTCRIFSLASFFSFLMTLDAL